MEKKFLEYSEYPKTFIQYTNSTILINYDVVQSTRTIEDKEETIYTSKYIIVNKIDKDNIVDTLIKYDLLPHNLIFDSNFNTGEGREELNASFNKTTKVTTIGPRFMGFLSHHNESYRKWN